MATYKRISRADYEARQAEQQALADAMAASEAERKARLAAAPRRYLCDVR
jgi:hypothetical protein